MERSNPFVYIPTNEVYFLLETEDAETRPFLFRHVGRVVLFKYERSNIRIDNSFHWNCGRCCLRVLYEG